MTHHTNNRFGDINDHLCNTISMNILIFKIYAKYQIRLTRDKK